MTPPLCDVKTEICWAAFCTDGYPGPFINNGSVRATRVAVQEYIGDNWRLEGETPQQGWKRAYRNGWRAIKVEVNPL
jgi:hypothetical protein